jgi:dipeptidyl aminopeptidase/acylaminoacyl peptidase
MKSFICWAALFLAAMLPSCVNSQSRPFSVKDDIGMVRFSDPLPDPKNPGSEDVRPSPDGKHFAVVTSKGLLDQDRIESAISIFDLDPLSQFLNDSAVRPPQPRVIAKIVSFPHREEANAYAPVIKDLRWSPDNRHLYFKGESPSGAYRLYIAKIDGTGFRALTPPSESVGRFDVAENLIVYTASHASAGLAVQEDSINADARVITGHEITSILFPGQLSTLRPETFTMSALRYAGGRWSTERLPEYSVTEIPYLSFLFPFAISPKGHKLMGLIPVRSIPDVWEHYEPASDYEDKRFHGGDPRSTSATLIQRPQEYSLIDLVTGAVSPLVDAPNARVLAYLDINKLAWAVDEHRVLVTNTFLPLVGREGKDFTRRKGPCAVASVDFPSLAAKCLFFEESTLHVEDISFGANDDEAIVVVKRAQGESALERYRLRNGVWELLSNIQAESDGGALSNLDPATHLQRRPFDLSIRQTLNEPPTLWVSNASTGEARQLWDPNPQFRRLSFGNASLYHWKDGTGYEWSGILIKPIDYQPGRRYPLVIQMYSFVDGEFITDGLYPTAFAARHLASAGFIVLQVKRRPSRLPEAEPRDQLEGYRSAIESLSQEGLIDRGRVGVVGFSWSCWYVVNALIKDPSLFAAATIADGLDNSYLQYLLIAESPDIQRQMERIRGTSPFGPGLKNWVEQAPGFHLDQVKAPVRIEAINPASVLQEWELYASLRMQGKPVDFIYFPCGTHIHQKPLERLESQQGNVDWMRFWLQGYEDPDPAKRAEYERWRGLRNQLK